MKGMQGLIIAGLLGLVGVALNWIYLQGKAKDFQTVSFIGIRSGATIEPGTTIKEQHLAAVTVPKDYADNLREFVYLYKDLPTVVGISATRSYREGDLIYREHYRTPPPQLKLQEGEKLIWIPANGDSFVPDLVDPGDQIEFIVPVYESRPAPTGDGTESGPMMTAANRVMRTMQIGPFRVGSLGSRLASNRLARGSRIRSSQERLVGIVIDTKKPTEMENAEALQARVLSGEYQNLGVALLEKVHQ